jgi:hypothetical protein
MGRNCSKCDRMYVVDDSPRSGQSPSPSFTGGVLDTASVALGGRPSASQDSGEDI